MSKVYCSECCYYPHEETCGALTLTYCKKGVKELVTENWYRRGSFTMKKVICAKKNEYNKCKDFKHKEGKEELNESKY